jgi:hypothetical protein
MGSSPEKALAQAPDRGAASRVTNLAGARDQPGLFTQRLLLPANFCSPVHVHNQDLHGLVLRGTLWMGYPDSAGVLHGRNYERGSFVPVPAGQQHVEGSAVETEIHLSGIGPLRTTIADSGAPRGCPPARDN